MPDIENKFKGKISVEYRDIADIENYKLMLSLEEKTGLKLENVLPVFYFQGYFLNGTGQVRENLEKLIAKGLKQPLSGKIEAAAVDLVARFKDFRPLAITSAGLLDGINPCAFTVIVFFISFLALQGYKRKELIAIGLSFILAVFLTYLLIGLGLFGFLYRLKTFWGVTRVINISIGILSIILGVFCVWDFFKFKRTKNTEGLILQLPASVKKQIHSVIGMHYRRHKQGHIARLMLSALVTGFLVSILEAVCTGQVYLPTITFVLKTAPLKLQALGYLLLYNLMFIIPLLVIFLFALLGVTSGEFSRILKKHLLTIKVLMALLFFSLGIFLIWQA